MTTNSFRWPLMTTNSYQWLPMTTNGCWWSPMFSDDHRWLPMHTNGCRWLVTTTDGCRWPADVHRCLLMTTNENWWCECLLILRLKFCLSIPRCALMHRCFDVISQIPCFWLQDTPNFVCPEVSLQTEFWITLIAWIFDTLMYRLFMCLELTLMISFIVTLMA